jgi:hypothetical protein
VGGSCAYSAGGRPEGAPRFRGCPDFGVYMDHKSGQLLPIGPSQRHLGPHGNWDCAAFHAKEQCRDRAQPARAGRPNGPSPRPNDPLMERVAPNGAPSRLDRPSERCPPDHGHREGAATVRTGAESSPGVVFRGTARAPIRALQPHEPPHAHAGVLISVESLHVAHLGPSASPKPWTGGRKIDRRDFDLRSRSRTR